MSELHNITALARALILEDQGRAGRAEIQLAQGDIKKAEEGAML